MHELVTRTVMGHHQPLTRAARIYGSRRETLWSFELDELVSSQLARCLLPSLLKVVERRECLGEVYGGVIEQAE